MILCGYDRKKLLDAFDIYRTTVAKELDRVQNLESVAKTTHQARFFITRWFVDKPDYSYTISYLTNELVYLLKLRKTLEASHSDTVYMQAGGKLDFDFDFDYL